MRLPEGDVVGVYANSADENPVEFLLTYSWAKAVGNELVIIGNGFRETLPGYLIAYPIIPISNKESVIFIVKLVRPEGLIIGPIYLNQLPQFVNNIMRPTAFSVFNVDPCYVGYWNYLFKQALELTIRENLLTNLFIFVWTAPMFTSLPIFGIPAYTDGNGTFYWDTCIAVGNTVNAESLYGYNLVYWVPVDVLGYENYLENPTMYYNNGFVVSQLGAIDYYYGYKQYSAGITNTIW